MIIVLISVPNVSKVRNGQNLFCLRIKTTIGALRLYVSFFNIAVVTKCSRPKNSSAWKLSSFTPPSNMWNVKVNRTCYATEETIYKFSPHLAAHRRPGSPPPCSSPVPGTLALLSRGIRATSRWIYHRLQIKIVGRGGNFKLKMNGFWQRSKHFMTKIHSFTLFYNFKMRNKFEVERGL